MKTRSWIVCVAATSVAVCQSAFAQFRPPPQPTTVPPEAYRRMDTHSTIDPRILQAQEEARKAKEKAEKFEAKKWEHRRALSERINQNPQWRGLQGYPMVGLRMAQEDAAHYFALRDMESAATANQWLQFRKAQIQKAMQEEIKTQAIMVAHDTVVAAAAAGAQAGGGTVANVGQAAKGGKTAQSLGTATSWHYDLLEKLTQ